MTQKPGSSERRSWKITAALALVAAAGATSWWVTRGDSAGPRVFPAVCTQCGTEQAVTVGDAPGQEEWPRECPHCHTKHLYMAKKCTKCGKLIPFKAPDAEKYGLPSQCPFCKRPVMQS
jgi:DNA-directed RNA polymerase subunit RPC12/RpoP